MVSSTVPRTTEGPGREFVSSFSGDLSDLRSAEHPFASDHQWVPPGDGRNAANFPPPSQPPIHNNIPHDASTKKCRIPDCTYNAYYDVFEQEQTEYCGKGHELWVWFDFDG